MAIESEARPVGLADIEAARLVASAVTEHTPIVTSSALTERVGGHVVLKAESLQRTGAFKIRGAMNKVASLGAAAAAGVTAGSAGNHAQALAFAARQFGVPCDIYLPLGAPITKIEACRAYGANVVEIGASLDEAVAAAQGTLGLELLADLDDLATVVVPLGGGGLVSGVAIAVKSIRPHVTVIGVQAAVCSPYAGGASPTGAVLTLADGIAVKRPGAFTGPLVERWVDQVVTVDEDAIADAMVMLMERAKLYVEGAGAVGVAALQSAVVAPADRGTTCVVLSGGNVDLGVVPALIRRHETEAGRRLVLFARIEDRPGSLVRFLGVFAGAGANLVEVEHQREGVHLHVRQTGVHATFEVRSPEHARAAIAAARAAGYVDLRASVD